MKKLIHIVTATCIILSATVIGVCQKPHLKASDLPQPKVLLGGCKLYEIANDSERWLLLHRPGVNHFDTVEQSNSRDDGDWNWPTSLEQDFEHYTVFTAACGSNYCRGASVLNKKSGKIVWGHEDFLAAASDRPDGEIVYSSGGSRNKGHMEVRVYDIASGLTERYPVPKDMTDCPAPTYCIDSVKVNAMSIQLTYRPGEDASKRKSISYTRVAGKRIKDDD